MSDIKDNGGFDDNEEYVDYEPEMVTLYDEEGTEIELELLDVVEYEGESYAVMLPPDEDEVVIMLLEELNDEEDSYSPVDDDDTLTAVFEIFKEKFSDEFDFE